MSAQLFTASVKAILYDGRGRLLLLARHSNRGDIFWDLPGGRIADGELDDGKSDLQAALERELGEELGQMPPLGPGKLLDACVWADGTEKQPKLLLYQLIPVEKAFKPTLSPEHAHHLWVGDLGMHALTAARMEAATEQLVGRALDEIAPPAAGRLKKLLGCR